MRHLDLHHIIHLQRRAPTLADLFQKPPACLHVVEDFLIVPLLVRCVGGRPCRAVHRPIVFGNDVDATGVQEPMPRHTQLLHAWEEHSLQRLDGAIDRVGVGSKEYKSNPQFSTEL